MIKDFRTKLSTSGLANDTLQHVIMTTVEALKEERAISTNLQETLPLTWDQDRVHAIANEFNESVVDSTNAKLTMIRSKIKSKIKSEAQRCRVSAERDHLSKAFQLLRKDYTTTVEEIREQSQLTIGLDSPPGVIADVLMSASDFGFRQIEYDMIRPLDDMLQAELFKEGPAIELCHRWRNHLERGLTALSLPSLPEPQKSRFEAALSQLSGKRYV
ncbi:hypothetical protein Q5752_006116 [Cryptotrichosporon argae]